MLDIKDVSNESISTKLTEDQKILRKALDYAWSVAMVENENNDMFLSFDPDNYGSQNYMNL